MSEIGSQKEEYYKQQGIAPGVPTMKGAYGDPENTKRGYNSIIDTLGNHDVPQGWIQTPQPNTPPGTTPGPPVSWNDPSNPDDSQAGYGYIPNDTTKEETFFYHSDHLGSTSYITDDKANITQYDAYLPYGELLVDEHSSSEDLPYKFNGKQFDEETGLYYYGARYMNPMASIWYGVDPLAEKYVRTSPYIYGGGNSIRIIDPNGKGWVETKDQGVYWDERVNSAKDGKFIPEGGRYLGNTVNMFDNQGQYKFGDNQGNILSAHPMDEVSVSRKKSVNFLDILSNMGLELCRYKELPKTSSGIYAPFNFDAIGLEAGVSFQIANLHYSYGLGFTISGSEGGLYGIMSGGGDLAKPALSFNAYINFIGYKNYTNLKNNIDLYEGNGYNNAATIGPLNAVYGTPTDNHSYSSYGIGAGISIKAIGGSNGVSREMLKTKYILKF